MSDIKILVSHRIDLDSQIIENPIYVPVHCGAIFDKCKNNKILGDDTGDNISAKRKTFCELTVQYWAWKNIKADYYGLCHYRRYLSFSDRKMKTNERNMVLFPYLSKRAIHKCCLDQPQKIKQMCEQYDAIILEGADVSKIPTPRGFKTTVKEHWAAHDDILIKKNDLQLLLELIQERQPGYLNDARLYFNQNRHIGYNCFVLKKELYYAMCEFQFDILFELEKRINKNEYKGILERTPGFMGEILFGIYVYHLMQSESVKIKELQLVYFFETRKVRSGFEKMKFLTKIYFKFYFNKILDFVLPKGTKRRKYIKMIIKKH